MVTRAVSLAIFLAGLSACQTEPTFDERYDAAAKKTQVMARDIDQDLGPSEEVSAPNATNSDGEKP